jgi:hypothetical protein
MQLPGNENLLSHLKLLADKCSLGIADDTDSLDTKKSGCEQSQPQQMTIKERNKWTNGKIGKLSALKASLTGFVMNEPRTKVS